MKNISIASLTHRVELCTMNDVVTTGGVMELARKGVFNAWAAIEMKKASSFSRPGYTVEEGRENQTHEIYVRYRTDFEISNAAWVYEERLSSSPRWFKVLKVADSREDGQWWCLKCQLVERSDDAQPPMENVPTFDIASKLPQGIKL